MLFQDGNYATPTAIAIKEPTMTLSNDRKKLIDKVVKLLALADSTNHSEEADTARRMAADLMAKHNIKLTEAEIRDEIERQKRTQSVKSMQKFDIDLIWAITKFNGVSAVFKDGVKFHEKKSSFDFIGTPQDIEAADYMIDIVKQQRKQSYEVYKADYIKNSSYDEWDADERDWRLWHNGFTMGVQRKLHDLKKAADNKINEWGLVVVNPHDIALKWFNENVEKTKTSKGRMRGGSRSGFESGKNVHLNKGVSTKTATKRIN